ncbi:hypothetical protein [Bradyrhizobium sp.]
MNRHGSPSGLSPLWLISLALILGTVILTAIPISIATGDTIKSSDWIGFAGNVVAAVMTLIGAAIAWFAVQQQITVQEKIANEGSEKEKEHREQIEAAAKRAAVVVMSHSVHGAGTLLFNTNQLLEIADWPHDRVDRTGKLVEKQQEYEKTFSAFKAVTSHFSIEQAGQSLGADDKIEYLLITSILNLIIVGHDYPPPGDKIASVRHLQPVIASLGRRVRRFDKSLGDDFDKLVVMAI